MVGPGIAHVGIDFKTWSDHTDVRPTVLVLVGLKDDYSHDGRALIEDFTGWAVPPAVKKNGIFVPLARAYKQINASVGQLGMASLQVLRKLWPAVAPPTTAPTPISRTR